MDRGRIALMVMGIIALVAMIAVSAYLGDRLETIEGRLRYSAPAASEPGAEAVAVDSPSKGQTVYVPVYSHVYSNGGQPYLVETTLSVRNVDPRKPIVLSAVRYFDTKGKLVKSYLQQPLQLAPLESTEFLVEQRNISGGSGANFLVEWSGDALENEPMIEAVMIGFNGSNSISLIRAGTPINTD